MITPTNTMNLYPTSDLNELRSSASSLLCNGRIVVDIRMIVIISLPPGQYTAAGM